MASASQARFGLFPGVVAFFFLVFVVIQFIRPPLTNPPVTSELQAPEEVKQVLKHSCYNCHSNETKLPWFDQVVPAYWLVASDVNNARHHLNFSEIGKLPAAQQKGLLFEAVNQIQLGAMPLPQYLAVHPDAKVTPEELAVLRNYVSAAPDPAMVARTAAKAVADASAADAQYGKWVQTSTATLDVQPEFNGLAFQPDYKNWKAISSTDRFDNHTMRVILGNDVAVKAGAFVQTELMVKDAKKYASTEGWGFGRWRGDDLKPYGKDAAFQNECTGCHAPVAKNDFVYTMPFQGQIAGGQ